MDAQQLPALRQRARQAFERDLPRLLETRLGQWVAYSGDRLVACAPHTDAIYQECFRQGLVRDQFVVFEVIPAGDEVAFGPIAFD